MFEFLKRIFWRHHWQHPDNGNPYRRTCTVCREQQEWDNGMVYETPNSTYHWTVWNDGDHKRHWEGL